MQRFHDGSAVGSTDPIVCADGSTAGLQRSTPDTGTANWNYARSQVSGSHWQTTISDPITPTADQTVINFQRDGNVYSENNFYETERQTYQGSASSGTLLQTLITCYNGNTSNCTTTAVSSPFTRKTVYTQWPSGLESETNVLYNSFGLTTEQDAYDYGSGSPGALLSKTLITYASLGNGIVSMPASVSVENSSGVTVSQQTFTYDQGTPTTTSGTPQHNSISGSRGNVTTANYYTTTSAYLTKTSTYFDTGNIQTATDFNGGVTTYTYSSASASCGNSFPTGITEAITTLTQSMTWNCTGGVQLTATDENSATTTTTYNDADFWRPNAVTDALSNQTAFYYQPNPSYCCPWMVASALSLNNGNSVVEDVQYKDGLGRTYVDQHPQSPNPSALDSVSYTFDSNGRPYSVSMPCSIGYAGTCSTPKTTQTYDALNRPLQSTDGGGGTVIYTYTDNDVLITVGPAPTGEHTKQRQLEYDALGRLTSVCEITSASGSGNCAQAVSQTGYWTKYTYDALGDLLTVTQNAQSSSNQQTRSYAYDAMSRLTSETNPESGTTSYTYDSDSTCRSGSSGDLIKRIDAVGNTVCFSYDALHRKLSVTYPSGSYASVTPSKYFVYDSATVNSVSMANSKSRLAEAYTCTSCPGTKLTDLGFSYTARGETSDVYELTPHSNSSYYHVTQTYWAHGAPSQLSNLAGLPTISYGGTIGSTVGLDGEGRITQVTAGSGQNPVTGVTYNNGSLPTQVNLGSGDNDIFAYDSNTLRMTQFKFNVGTQSKYLNGALTWNANSSLNQLAITDQYNSSDTQTCNYTHDDLARIATANCGSAANQTFGYDPFGNISKSGSPNSFQPTYSAATNRFSSIPGCSSLSYDSNGNVLNDCNHSYTWDADGNSISLDGNTLTYDALDRAVEKGASGTYTQIVYSPGGGKLALMSGQTLQKALVSLPGQATAVYTSSGLDHYRHSDWLGSTRLTSSPTQSTGFISSLAYAPFGETYASSGTIDPSFTGMNPDTTGSSTNNDYDFLAREYSNEGRWVSPDPAGLAAVDPSNPQSWNRYSYVLNNPLALIDPRGLDCVYVNDAATATASEYAADSGVSFNVVSGDGPCDGDNAFYVEGSVDQSAGITVTDNGDVIVTLSDGSQICSGSCDITDSVTVNADAPPPDPSLTAAFFSDLFSWQSAKQAQKDAWNKGYYSCLLNKNAGTALAPVFTHVAGEIATKTVENNAAAIAGAYFHFTDGRFTAWGNSSQVLVPEAASTIRTVAKGANVVGWVVFDAELAHSIYECSGKLQ